MNKYNKTETFIDTENQKFFAGKEAGRGRKELGEETEMYKLLIAK